MNLITLSAAQALRDGGIDAMAALDSALAIAISSAPEAMHSEMKLAIGRAMSAIMDETFNPAVRTFPELQPSNEVWRATAKERVLARAASYQADAQLINQADR